MSHLIKIYAVCKFIFFSSLVPKEFKGGEKAKCHRVHTSYLNSVDLSSLTTRGKNI